MKSIYFLFILTVANCASAVENNAYIFLDRLDGRNMQTCIIFNDHYYVAPVIEHYEYCPCQEEEFIP